MNSLVSSSLRLVARPAGGIYRRVLAPCALRPSFLAPSALGSSMPVITRGYAKKQGLDAVVSDRQRKQEFVRMLEEETGVLRQGLEDADASNVSSEVIDRFLKETGFKMEADKENGIIKLTRSLPDKTVEVIFGDIPEEYDPREYEEEGEEGEEGEGETAEGEEKAGEEEESENSQEEREHAFTVEIKATKAAKEGATPQSFLFQCYAKNDGSFVVNKLTSGDRIPVQISYWNEELQRELLQYLDPMGINERLSYFIHQYLNRRETEDNISVLQEFRDFVAGR